MIKSLFFYKNATQLKKISRKINKQKNPHNESSLILFAGIPFENLTSILQITA